MYKISVPVMNSNVLRSDRERLLKELRRLDAERVFLALDCYETDPAKRQKVFEELRENCRYFKEHGFEVGSWNWTFWIKNRHPLHPDAGGQRQRIYPICLPAG